jgi:hypothetical protein
MCSDMKGGKMRYEDNEKRGAIIIAEMIEDK